MGEGLGVISKPRTQSFELRLQEHSSEKGLDQDQEIGQKISENEIPPEPIQDPSSEERNADFTKKKNPRKKKTRKDKKLRELLKETDVDLEIPKNLEKVKISNNKNFHY